MKKIKCLISCSFLFVFLFSTSVNATVIVTNGLSHSHNMNGVDKARGIIAIKNVGKKSQRVRFYIMDQSMDCISDGSFYEPGTIERSNSSWIALAESQITLDTGEVYELAYEINKPSELEMKGSFWSMIMIENVPDVSTEKPVQGIRVKSNLRYAVQIITEVEEEKEYDIEFDTVYYDAESQSIILELINPSITIMRMFFEFRIFSDKGEKRNYEDESYTKLYPSTCRQIKLPLKEANPGNYDGVIIVKSDNQGVFGYNIQFEISE